MSYKLPKGEVVEVTCRNKHGETTHLITSKLNAEGMYYLWSVDTEGNLERLGKSPNPKSFDRRVFGEQDDLER